ncbi:MAG: hypothetical protein FWG70_03725 [Oscillospiraceae bacterium]|nr:hypothetical protein [Oscillospiraceae bacterium]
MGRFKRVDILKKHVLSEGITAGLTAELLKNTGKDDFFVVFLSVCDKIKRAKVFHGTGNSLSRAWANAEKSLNAFAEKKPLNDVWVKADVVISFEEIATLDLNKILAKDGWKNFTRLGISFDREFKNAFLEAEINGNKIITYYSEKEIEAHAIDYNSNRISLDNINRYLKMCYGSTPQLENVPDLITVFNARGLFCGEDCVIHELYNDHADYGRRRIDIIDGEEVKNTIIAASEYLASQIGDDGKFVYGYFPIFNSVMDSYNIVRHASSLWSLINLYRMSGDNALIPKLESALDYMEKFIVYKDKKTAYLVEQKPGKDSEVKLGANGVAIIMYTEYMDVFKNRKYADTVNVLANGILKLQNPVTGEYWHILEFPGFAPKEEFRTVYYDGEATFGLARAYAYTKNKKHLKGAKAAVENFIAKDYVIHRDHWVSYALFEVTKYIKDVRYYEFALQNADENLCRIYNRETSYHTYLELLMASWRAYKRALENKIKSDYIENYDPTLFAQTIYRRARHMLNGYFYPEYAMYMKAPETVVGSFMVRHHNYRVRIDDIQHFIGGYYFYSVYYDDIKEHLTDEFIRRLDVSREITGEESHTANIFYGVLNEDVVRKHINKWINIAGIPDIFVEKDENLHKYPKKLLGKYDVVSLNEALECYPNADFWVTYRKASVTAKMLLTKIPPEKLHFLEADLENRHSAGLNL